MTRLVLAWILVAASVVMCVQYSTRHTGQPTTPAFDYVCDELGERYDWLTCDDLDAPIIVTSRVVAPPYLGFYWRGEIYIFIRPNLDPIRARNVVVHETVHYVLDHLNVLVSKCHSELIARQITADYSGIAIDPSWKKRYGCGSMAYTRYRDSND